MNDLWEVFGKDTLGFLWLQYQLQIFNAVEKGNDISFKQLHSEDNGRISYKKTCSVCDEEVPYGDIAKGYEYEPDQYVVFKKEEFLAIKLKSNRAIDVDASLMLMKYILRDSRQFIMLGLMGILLFRLSIYSEKLYSKPIKQE